MSLQRGARLYLRRGLGGGDRLWPPHQGPGPRHLHPVFISVVPSGVSAMAAPASPPAPLCESKRERKIESSGCFPGVDGACSCAACAACTRPALEPGDWGWSPGTTAWGPVLARQPAGSGEDAAQRREVCASGSWEDAKETPAWLVTRPPARSGRGRQRGCPGHHRLGQRMPEREPVPAVAWGQRRPCPCCGSSALAHGHQGPPRPAGCPAPRGAGVSLPRAARSTCPGRHLPVASLVWSVTPVAKPASVFSFI